jgi:transcriptional regulator with XRE-family HTH domain
MAERSRSNKLTSGFARRLKAARVVGGYTQEEFSHLLGIKRDRYAKYELGQAEPPFFILTKVSELTHQSLDTLIGGRAILGHEAMTVVGSPLADIQAVSRTEASWWWKSDRAHRVVEVWHLHNFVPQEGRTPRSLGKTRWQTAGGDTKTDEIWQNHLEDLEAHRVFENFRYSFTSGDGSPIDVFVSGRPVFDDRGKFQGYAGSAHSTARGALDTEAL